MPMEPCLSACKTSSAGPPQRCWALLQSSHCRRCDERHGRAATETRQGVRARQRRSRPRHAGLSATGCGACRSITGVPGARGRVAFPIQGIAGRNVIGDVLANTPENLARWIENPRAINPSTAMPNLGLTKDEARDVAAFLIVKANWCVRVASSSSGFATTAASGHSADRRDRTPEQQLDGRGLPARQ